MRSAGTSVRSLPSGCGARPRATRVSWTSSRACLTAASAVRLAVDGAGRTPRGRSRPLAKSCLGPREVGPGAGRRVASLLRRAATRARSCATCVVDVLDRPLELPPLAPGLGQDAPDLGLGGHQVGLGGDHGRLLDVDLDLVRLLVELDQQVPLLHPVVVVHQDPAHLAGDPGGHVGHVAVDVGVIGGDRVQHRLHGRGQEVSSDRQAGHGPRPQQPSPPGVRWRPGRRGRRGRRGIGRRVRGPVVRMSRCTGRRRTRVVPRLRQSQPPADASMRLPSCCHRVLMSALTFSASADVGAISGSSSVAYLEEFGSGTRSRPPGG